MKLRLQVNGRLPPGDTDKRPMANGASGQRPGSSTTLRRPLTEPVRPHRELVDDFAEDEDTEAFLRASGRNRRVRRGLIPQSKTGRIAAVITVAACLLAACGGTVLAARFITTDPKFLIPSSRAIEVDGNTHVTRSQLLSVFGEDVDRNIFSVPMEQRRAQLEQMPWVEHATVMRLLPNRIRVQVRERVPVAFVREGGRIGLVDASGVLLNLPPETPGTAGYTFPVITGVKSSELPEERAEQMKLYAAFLKDLDSDGKATSAQLSEIDLSDPEDARALIPDHNSEILVHFGKENFLARYQRFEEHIAEWRSQYPRLSNVDMRYERQVVLQMPPKDATVSSPTGEKLASDTDAARPQVASANHVHLPSTAKKQLPNASRSPASLAMRSSSAKTASPTHPGEMDAATRKRVDAIEARMAQRQKERARSQPAGAASGAVTPN